MGTAPGTMTALTFVVTDANGPESGVIVAWRLMTRSWSVQACCPEAGLHDMSHGFPTATSTTSWAVGP